MADLSQTPQSDQVVEDPSSTKPKPPSRLPFNTLYALPAPLRTFPLPTLVPHNPISLFHVLYVWFSQAINPPTSNFDPIYKGWWSPETRSVHVTDSRSIRGLWEQGFYGKGSLSRSEPNWIEREKARRGTKSKLTSEDLTKQRREERQQTKWERARKEREAIDQKLLDEAEETLRESLGDSSILTVEESHSDRYISLPIPDRNDYFLVKAPKVNPAPVGPLELLSLPNSSSDLNQSMEAGNIPLGRTSVEAELDKWYGSAPVGPMQLLALPNSIQQLPHRNGNATPASENQIPSESHAKLNGSGNGIANGLGINGHAKWQQDTEETIDEIVNGSVHSGDSTPTANATPNGSTFVNENGSAGSPKIKRQKSVRFSPTVEKNTFIQSEPPSPERALTASTTPDCEEDIQNQEHYQLTMEEAFFLAYGLGALSILDPSTKSPISNENLFYLFRKSSYYPPVPVPKLSSDDPFLLNYIVYHHYRSLGWCVRGGAKFSCDFMLYNRGPVFSHAEFAIIILPSYSDKYWSSDVFLQNYAKEKEHRTWAWLHCINRVITNVRKSLVLVYVDIPKPLDTDAEKRLGVDGMIKRYQVREFVLKRWSMNRERDTAKK